MAAPFFGGSNIPLGPSGATAQTSGFAQAGPETAASAGTSPVSTTAALQSSTSPSKSSTTPSRSSFSGATSDASPRRGSAVTYAGFGGVIAAPGFGGGFGGGGGLASSPNVPRPGTSIDPATGKPYTAGLTRAELEAIKAKGADLLDPAPLAVQARRSSVSELSGREQAARQLTAGLGGAGQAGSAGAAGHKGLAPIPGTPGEEMPGAWGPVDPLGAPGSGPNAASSIYTDVANTLDKVGHVAYNILPNQVKEALSNSPTSRTAASPGSSPTARRSSAAGLFEQAKTQGNKLAAELQGTGRRASSVISTEGNNVFQQVKGIFNEIAGPVTQGQMGKAGIMGSTGSTPTSPRASTSGATTAVAPRVSLPSTETAGAAPGEHSSGVGALPGSSNETGVAILPDEKKTAPGSSIGQNQAPRPGEVSSTPLPSHSSGPSGSDTDKLSSGVAGMTIYPPVSESAPSAHTKETNATHAPTSPVRSTRLDGPTDSKISEDLPAETVLKAVYADDSLKSKADTPDVAASHSSGDEGHLSESKALAVLPAEAGAAKSSAVDTTSGYSGLGSATHTDASHHLRDSHASGGIAPALPATFLGLGAALGATDLKAVPGVSDHSTSDPSITAVSAPADSHSNLLDIPARVSNDRTTSMASVTAIRHGTEGSREPKVSPLSEEAPSAASTGLASSLAGSHAPGESGRTSQAISLTPGNEHEGVGHPSTRHLDGATREPGSYPAADHSGPAVDTSRDTVTAAAVPAATHKHEHSTPSAPTANTHTGSHASTGAGHSDHSTSYLPSSDDATPNPLASVVGGEAAPGLYHREHDNLLPTGLSKEKTHHEVHDQKVAEAEAADHVGGVHTTAVHPTSTTAATSATATAPAAASITPTSATTSASSNTPVSPAAAVTTAGSAHHRTGSGASGGNGKKKGGFMSKLKEKLRHD